MADKLTIVGADWCGWTQKQNTEIASSQHANMFEYHDCAKDPSHDMCKDVTGFPVIKNAKGDVCQMGFADPNTDDFRKMIDKCIAPEK